MNRLASAVLLALTSALCASLAFSGETHMDFVLNIDFRDMLIHEALSTAGRGQWEGYRGIIRGTTP